MSNIIFGSSLYGSFVWGAGQKKKGGGGTGGGGTGGGGTAGSITYIPDAVQVIFFNRDGTKTAIFSNGTENNPFSQLQFELAKNGCGSCTITFKQFHAFTEIMYGQRVDIYLFGDKRPWYSGQVLTRPDSGGTATDFKITCYGFFDKLSKVLIFAEYTNREIADIVREICRLVERKTGIVFNGSKIYNVGYRISKIVFDGVSAKEALEQLSEFATDFVYGVDEYHEFYFKPRTDKINEEARFWVGAHLNSFLPDQDISKIVNYARIKGASVDEAGESWLATVEDKQSQEQYGVSEAVWTLPTAYTAADAERWGQSELDKVKEPKMSAKVGGVELNYPKPDGVFWVRRLSVDGQALITDTDGNARKYPITKLKYTVSGDKGITCDMELGEPPAPPISKYLLDIERNARNNELLQQATNKTGKAASK